MTPTPNELLETPNLVVDPYGKDHVPASAPGETVIAFNEDGSITARRKLREERTGLSGREKRAVRECKDDAIVVRHRSELTGKTYYSIGQVTVVWYGGGKTPYVCLSCVTNSCAHVDRCTRFRKENAA